MLDLSPIYDVWQSILPFDCLETRFMQRALVGLILLAPITAAMGVHVVNLRMAFFSDAISHSAFAGIALGLIFQINPHWTMPIFGLLIGLGITALQRHSSLSSDTAIGVFFSFVVAFGLAVVSRDYSISKSTQRFLYGDILTTGDLDILLLACLLAIVILFQIWSYNRMLYIGLSQSLAKAHGVNVVAYQYIFSALLSLSVMLCVSAVGVLLVTALLIVPSAAARNFARSAGSMFSWAVLISMTSATCGLIISAQDWARTATGATIVLISCLWFLVSLLVSRLRS